MIYTDKQRLEAIHNLPCIACEIEDELRGRYIEQPNKTTAHHIVDKGYRRLSGGHKSTLPLCEWHHMGYRLLTHDFVDMSAKWGPSMEHEKKKFIARYGTERQLLVRVNTKLEAA
jgi:hypothetical protein